MIFEEITPESQEHLASSKIVPVGWQPATAAKPLFVKRLFVKVQVHRPPAHINFFSKVEGRRRVEEIVLIAAFV